MKLITNFNLARLPALPEVLHDMIAMSHKLWSPNEMNYFHRVKLAMRENDPSIEHTKSATRWQT